MENLIIEGIISTTSNKQSSEFKVEKPQKTAYLLLDKENADKLEKFGVRKYTSKTGEDFYCLKVVEQLKVYFDKSKASITVDAGVDVPNFKTEKVIKMNVIKGEKTGNTFYRLQALLLNELEDLVQIEAENPFA